MIHYLATEIAEKMSLKSFFSKVSVHSVADYVLTLSQTLQ